MTDNEIIKAFECCNKCDNGKGCFECPYRQYCPDCLRRRNEDTIDLINRQKEEIQRLENQVAINKGAMRAYHEAFENAHDEAVTDFSHFLIDKAKDGIIEICDLPDLVAEWRSPKRKDAELMRELNAAFDEAAEGMKPSPTFCEGLIAGNSWYDDRFIKVE